MTKPAKTITIEVKCVTCGHRWKVGPEQKDQPECPKCYGPGIPVKATAR